MTVLAARNAAATALPLQDDRAEKHKRRRESAVALMKSADRRRSVLRPQTGAGAGGAMHAVDVGAPLPGADAMPPVVIAENYEQWMKIAADNKINTNNSWSVQLIDYFHELSLMRDGDHNINFTKASCTLDGCVKVYTSRVDAVATETNQLLLGLADGHRKDKAGNDDDEELTAEDGNEDAPTRKKSARQTSTVEQSSAALDAKSLETEFAVDPLFKKTCADFDEGGASGLLLNHLCMYGDGRIVFDASDIDVKIHDRDERAEDPAIYAKRFDTAPFMAFWKGNLEALDDKTLCASLDGFSFLNEADSTALDTDNFKLDLEDGEATRSGSAMDVDGNDDDSIQGNAYDDRDLGQDDVDIDDYSLAGDIPMAAFDDGVDDEAWGMAANGDGVGSDVVDAQVPVGGRTGGDLMTQLTSSLVASGGNDMYSYFDAALMRNWAGPLHWKVQRPVANARRADVDASAVAAKKSKKEKEPFFVDFSATGTTIADDKLFAGTDASSTLLPPIRLTGKTATVAVERNLLPADLHYSPVDLVKLFMKPTLEFKQLRGGRQPNAHDDHLSENPFDDDGLGGGMDDHSDNEDARPPVEASQFYLDADEDDIIADTFVPNTQTLELLQVKKTRVDFVSFSKTAKRVDVQKLKSNIWKELTHDEDGADTQAAEETSASAPPAEKHLLGNRKFTDMIQHVRAQYPQDKAEQITASFYFICLLHLANEKHLDIEGQADLNDLVIH